MLDDVFDIYGFNVLMLFFGKGYDIEVKVGFDYFEKICDGNNIDLVIRNFVIDDDLKVGLCIDEIFIEDNIYNLDFYVSFIGSLLFQDNIGEGDKYFVVSKFIVGYFMVDVFFNQKFCVSGGVCWEEFQ